MDELKGELNSNSAEESEEGPFDEKDSTDDICDASAKGSLARVEIF